MIDRGTIRWVFAAGSLAMALKKAVGDSTARRSRSASPKTRPTPTSRTTFRRERIEQAKRMVADGRSKGIEFVVPVDFVLAGRPRRRRRSSPAISSSTSARRRSELFEQKIGEFLDRSKSPAREPPSRSTTACSACSKTRGSKRARKNFIPQLKRMKDAGVEVYIGGGEGGTALEKYGQPDWVTHIFTAGGTVLNALGSEPVPYLQALLWRRYANFVHRQGCPCRIDATNY